MVSQFLMRGGVGGKVQSSRRSRNRLSHPNRCGSDRRSRQRDAATFASDHFNFMIVASVRATAAAWLHFAALIPLRQDTARVIGAGGPSIRILPSRPQPEGIAKDKLKQWCDELGWETLLNRAGTTFRTTARRDRKA